MQNALLLIQKMEFVYFKFIQDIKIEGEMCRSNFEFAKAIKKFDFLLFNLMSKVFMQNQLTGL